MGSSTAMSSKERKQIIDGLIDQGAVYVRDTKHGSLLNLKGGRRILISNTPSDWRARTAMRVEVKKSGYHWPLDPPERKDTTMPSEHATATNDLMPAAVAAMKGLPTSDAWQAVAPYLTEFADRKFWTSELQDRIPADTSGFRNKSAGNVRCQEMLWFAGFRPFEKKVNRNGFSYHWHRPAGAEWPTKFAPTAQEKMATLLAQQAQSRPKPGPGLQRSTPPTPPPSPQAEPEPQVEIEPVTVQNDDDVELGLAAEQEARAIRAERERDVARMSLATEKDQHGKTRRDLMVRIAGWERRGADLQSEIVRLRALLEERSTEPRQVSPDSVLRRAHDAEQQVQSLQHDVEDLTKRLRETEDGLNRAQRDAGQAQDELGRRRLESVGVGVDDGWWPLEPQGGQTIAETMGGAKLFGLEVRVQARRK